MTLSWDKKILKCTLKDYIFRSHKRTLSENIILDNTAVQYQIIYSDA